MEVDLIPTTGWCPFVANMSAAIPEALLALPGVETVEVKVVWEPAWTPDRLSESARAKLTHAARGARALPSSEERRLMATIEEQPAAKRDRKVDAFVFDCVCHIFNFDPANALGAARADVRRAPLRLPPAADQGGRGDPHAARSS